MAVHEHWYRSAESIPASLTHDFSLLAMPGPHIQRRHHVSWYAEKQDCHPAEHGDWAPKSRCGEHIYLAAGHLDFLRKVSDDYADPLRLELGRERTLAFFFRGLKLSTLFREDVMLHFIRPSTDL